MTDSGATAGTGPSMAAGPGSPRSLEAAEYAAFAAAGARRDVPAGGVLFERAEPGRSMFVIESGSLRLSFGDGLADRIVGPREYCGELAVFIGRHSRMASAVAEQDCVLHAIDQTAFEQLLAREPLLVARFMRRCFAYLVASETQLILGLRRRNEDLMRTLDSLRETRSELGLAQQLVRTDELTGLSNRRGLYRYLEEFGEAPMPDARLGLLLIDLDHFKQVNDRHGHGAGDDCLRAVADAIRARLGPEDLFGRFGGEEFVVVLPGKPAEQARALGERLRQAVADLRVQAEGAVLQLTVSIGVAARLPRESQPQAIVERADKALYAAKRSGRNQVQVASAPGGEGAAMGSPYL